MKELQNNALFNDIITTSLSQNVSKDAEAFLNLDTSGINDTPKIKKKILRRAEHQKTSLLLLKLRLVAVACLVVLALALTACLCTPEIRNAMWGAIIEWNDGFIQVEFTPNETESTNTETEAETSTPDTAGATETPKFPTSIENIATSTYLPKDYTVLSTNSYEKLVQIEYADASGKFKFLLTQRVFAPDVSNNVMIDSDNATVKTVFINSSEGVLVEYTDNGLYYLTWLGTSYQYALYGYFDSYAELIKIAEGVQIVPITTTPQYLEKIATATYLPSGYYHKVKNSSLLERTTLYYNASGTLQFQLLQKTRENNLTVNNGIEPVRNVTINGFAGILVEYTDTNSYYLVWQDAAYQYALYGEFASKNELLQIAEGIKTE